MNEKMGYEDWFEKFQPEMSSQGQVVLLETYGEDLNLVSKADPRFIWTVIDDDNGNWAIVPRIAFVNRIAYVITRKPHKLNVKEAKA